MVLHGVCLVIEDVHPVFVEYRLHHRFVFFDRPRQNQDVFIAVTVLGDQFFDFIGHMEDFRLFRFAAPDPDSFLLVDSKLKRALDFVGGRIPWTRSNNSQGSTKHPCSRPYPSQPNGPS